MMQMATTFIIPCMAKNGKTTEIKLRPGKLSLSVLDIDNKWIILTSLYKHPLSLNNFLYICCLNSIHWYIMYSKSTLLLSRLG